MRRGKVNFQQKEAVHKRQRLSLAFIVFGRELYMKVVGDLVIVIVWR
jgi:hypothetical protein